MNIKLSFLTEVRKSETLRRLIFFLLTNTDKNKNDNRNKIRKHLDKLLCRRRKSGDIYANDIKSAEKE